MRKYLLFFPVFILLATLIACSDDDDNTSSSLTFNGQSIKISDVEGELNPEGSWDMFTFWVNDAFFTHKSVYIQATIPYDVELVDGANITTDTSILMQWNDGDEYFMSNMGNYRSGKILIESMDTNKKVLTLAFNDYKCVSNLRNEAILSGTLVIPYKVIEYDTTE